MKNPSLHSSSKNMMMNVRRREWRGTLNFENGKRNSERAEKKLETCEEKCSNCPKRGKKKQECERI